MQTRGVFFKPCFTGFMTPKIGYRGLIYDSPTGTQEAGTVITCLKQTRKSWTINSYVAVRWKPCSNREK